MPQEDIVAEKNNFLYKAKKNDFFKGKQGRFVPI